ncbi:MAG: hypothetical protein WAU02_02575 [Candidatus Saccharimonadales bacterium]
MKTTFLFLFCNSNFRSFLLGLQKVSVGQVSCLIAREAVIDAFAHHFPKAA